MFFLLAFIIFLIIFAPQAATGAKNGLLLWFNNVLPVLFPFSFLLQIIMSADTLAGISRHAGFLTRRLLHLSPFCSFCILAGFLCGFPMGAVTASQALKNKQIDKRSDLTEEEEIQVIMKEIKQTKETLEMTPADRTDIIEECNRRLTVLEAYAPKMMGEDEIKAIIEGVLSELGIENPTGKDKGNIMKHLMPKVKGKADGKLVNDLVSTYFK